MHFRSDALSYPPGEGSCCIGNTTCNASYSSLQRSRAVDAASHAFLAIFQQSKSASAISPANCGYTCLSLISRKCDVSASMTSFRHLSWSAGDVLLLSRNLSNKSGACPKILKGTASVSGIMEKTFGINITSRTALAGSFRCGTSSAQVPCAVGNIARDTSETHVGSILEGNAFSFLERALMFCVNAWLAPSILALGGSRLRRSSRTPAHLKQRPTEVLHATSMHNPICGGEGAGVCGSAAQSRDGPGDGCGGHVNGTGCGAGCGGDADHICDAGDCDHAGGSCTCGCGCCCCGGCMPAKVPCNNGGRKVSPNLDKCSN